MTIHYRLAAIGGDGVGPEVVASAKRVLAAAGGVFDFAISWTDLVFGGAAIDAYGTAAQDEDVEACRRADAVLLGAVGGPKWDDPTAPVRPEQALFALRGGLGLFANLRPVTMWPALVDASTHRDTLRLDLRGHASSVHRGVISIEVWCADLCALLDAGGYTQAVLVGHSLGANVAAHFAQRHAARVAG